MSREILVTALVRCDGCGAEVRHEYKATHPQTSRPEGWGLRQKPGSCVLGEFCPCCLKEMLMEETTK